MPVSDIAPELVSHAVPLDSLHQHPDNPRKGDVEAIMSSLRRFGQVRPIVVQEGTDVIVAGNHTFQAVERLGWDKIAAIKVPLTDDEARAYLIADNRLGDTATYDDQGLLAVLERVMSSTGLEGTGFTPDDVDDLVAALDRIPTTPEEEFTGDYAERPEDTAARWEGRNEGQKREVVFLLEADKFERFKEYLTKLKGKYEIDSMALAIYEAVEREANA